MVNLTFTAELWLARGEAPWHFVTLPHDLADELAEAAPSLRGFGSLRVEAAIGDTTWQTSLFPDSKAGSYLLPVKKDVRVRERLVAGDEISVIVTLVEI